MKFYVDETLLIKYYTPDTLHTIPNEANDHMTFDALIVVIILICPILVDRNQTV